MKHKTTDNNSDIKIDNTDLEKSLINLDNMSMLWQGQEKAKVIITNFARYTVRGKVFC